MSRACEPAWKPSSTGQFCRLSQTDPLRPRCRPFGPSHSTQSTSSGHATRSNRSQHLLSNPHTERIDGLLPRRGEVFREVNLARLQNAKWAP